MEPHLRRRQAIIAGHRGTTEATAALLSDDDPQVRASAFGALHRTGTLTAAQFEDAVADIDPIVRRRIAGIGATFVDVSLSALLDDADSTVVEVAAWAAGERDGDGDGDGDESGEGASDEAESEGESDEDLVPKLIEIATTHEDPLCRESAIAALGAIGDERGVPAILVGCADKPAVRRRAVLALAPFDGEEVEAALNRALEDRDWQVRQAAEDLI